MFHLRTWAGLISIYGAMSIAMRFINAVRHHPDAVVVIPKRLGRGTPVRFQMDYASNAKRG
jgi:hypothetical protein